MSILLLFRHCMIVSTKAGGIKGGVEVFLPIARLKMS